MTKSNMCNTDKDSNSFFKYEPSTLNYDDHANLQSSHGISISIEEEKHFQEDERMQSFKSYNTSVIDRINHPKLE